MSEPPSNAPAQAEDLVRFFRALPPRVREEYRALAEADRAFGEDVAREAREAGEAGDGKDSP